MPWHDWQFWLVSALAVWGAWVVARPLLPRGVRTWRVRGRAAEADQSCPGCPSGSGSGSAAARGKPKRRRVALTVERRRV